MVLESGARTTNHSTHTVYKLKCKKCGAVRYSLQKKSKSGGKFAACECSGGVERHGLTGTRIYKIYAKMLDRTRNPNNPDFKNYGARGIVVCKEWEHSVAAFGEWALNNGYSDTLTIERKNVNGNYEPENCCWISKSEQSNNRRNTIAVEMFGHIDSLKRWCEFLGLNYGTVRARVRYRGWSAAEAFDVESARLVS